MEEKKVVKISFVTILFIISIIVIIVMAVLLIKVIKDKNSANDEISELKSTVITLNEKITKLNNMPVYEEQANKEEIEQQMDDEKALMTATQVYEEAYNLIKEGNGITDFNTTYPTTGKNGENIDTFKMNLDILKSVFTDRTIENLKEKLITDNGTNYYSQAPVSLFMNTIFGMTNQNIRKLELLTKTDDTIIVTGKVKGEKNSKPLYLVLKKVNENWLIDLYE